LLLRYAVTFNWAYEKRNARFCFHHRCPDSHFVRLEQDRDHNHDDDNCAKSPTGNWPAFATGVVAWHVNSPALLSAADIWQAPRGKLLIDFVGERVNQ
jgi:hypothetical protein